MSQHAGLGWYVVFANHLVHQMHQLCGLRHIVGRRIDSDHGITAAVQKTVENTRGNTSYVIRGVIGLQSGRQMPG